MICGTINLRKIWHEHRKHLSTKDVATIPWAIHISLFQQYCSHILLIIYVISEENKLNQLGHPAWKCHHTSLWTAKTFFIRLKVCCVPSNVGGSEKNRLWCVATGVSVEPKSQQYDTIRDVILFIESRHESDSSTARKQQLKSVKQKS